MHFFISFPASLCWPFRFRCEFTNSDIHCRPAYMQQKGLMPLELTQYHLQSNSFHNVVVFRSLVELAIQGKAYAFTCRSSVHDFQRVCAIFNFQSIYIYIIYMRTYINIYKYSTIQYRVELPLFLSQRQPPVAFPYRCKKVEHKIVPVF